MYGDDDIDQSEDKSMSAIRTGINIRDDFWDDVLQLINNSENLITSSTSDFATITMAASLGSTSSISVKDVLTTYTAGSFAGFNPVPQPSHSLLPLVRL